MNSILAGTELLDEHIDDFRETSHVDKRNVRHVSAPKNVGGHEPPS